MWEISCTSPPQGLSTRRSHCIWKLETDCSVDLSRAPHIAPLLLPYLVYYSSSGVFGAPDDPCAILDPACEATESLIAMCGSAAAALGKSSPVPTVAK